MRKLVLGIIAVVCVQFAFVIFMQLQFPTDFAVAPAFTAPPAVNTDRSWLRELDRSGLSMPEPETVTAESEPQHSAGPAITSRARVSTSKPADASSDQPLLERTPKRVKTYFPASPEAVPGDFDTVVIRYNRTAEVESCESFVAPKSRKRSFIGKAVPVVKKPWEWMRSAASKIY